MTYIPNIVRYKTTIQTKIVQFFNTTVKPSFVDLDNYIVDIFVGVHKVCFLVCMFYAHTSCSVLVVHDIQVLPLVAISLCRLNDFLFLFSHTDICPRSVSILPWHRCLSFYLATK